MVWLGPSGKSKERVAPGGPLNGGSSQGKPADNDGENKGDDEGRDGERANSFINASWVTRNQMPIKLEFKIPRNSKVFNCAAIHKEWFAEVKKKDPSTRIITYREAAISELE